jgi:hypothetical protein
VPSIGAPNGTAKKEGSNMPADLVPPEAIPQLAAQIDSPSLYWVLRYLQKAHSILNGRDVDDNLADFLQRLTNLGLADPAYTVPTDGKPFLWTRNGNGSRVLRYLESSPACQERLEPRFKTNHRAHTALASLPDRDQLRALLAVEEFQTRDPASWPGEETVRLGEDKPLFMVRVSPELWAFIKVLDSGDTELTDLVPEGTLRLFLEKQRAGAKV